MSAIVHRRYRGLFALLSYLLIAAINAPTQVGDAERPALASAILEEPAPVAAAINRAQMLMPAWETGVTGAIPPSAAPDVLGAFRFICTAAHLAYDDPIVFAGQPGKSHLHQFFGNTRTDASSTYQSLRTSGESTCMNPLNRSGYWIPAMLDGRGGVIRPDFVSIYYKRIPAGNPACTKAGERCAPIPRGLRFVFGYDMVTGKAPTGDGVFDCQGRGATRGHYRTITEAAVACPTGAQLGMTLTAPPCWDGKRLDSANHRDHMAYGSYGNWGYWRCPKTHPVLIPAFTLGAWYTVDDTLRRDGPISWHLSSDEMDGKMMPPGSTFHADWFGAWDDATMQVWTDHCINKMLNCSGGDLGNGTQLKQVGPFSTTAKPHRVPVPPRPAAMSDHHHVS